MVAASILDLQPYSVRTPRCLDLLLYSDTPRTAALQMKLTINLSAVQDIHPSDRLNVADSAKINLRGLQVLMAKDYLRYDFQGDAISTGICCRVSPEVMGRYPHIQFRPKSLDHGSGCGIADRKDPILGLKSLAVNVFFQLL